MRNIFRLSIFWMLLLSITACSENNEKEGSAATKDEAVTNTTEDLPQDAKVAATMDPVSADTITTGSGLQYILLQEGSGPKPQQGQNVEVHYAGFLTDGTKFDSSFDRNEPIEFSIGTGAVIAGWDEGIALLNTGSKARLIIPSYLAYGSGGYGNIIPPDATLIFDVELVGIR